MHGTMQSISWCSQYHGSSFSWCVGQAIPHEKKKLGANEASAQGPQNALYNECHTNFLTELWAFENRLFVWQLYEARLYRKIQYK
jgi:hypothetical protein